MYSLYTKTLGCKVNQYETDLITSILTKWNFKLCAQAELAHVIIVNTCAVTSIACNKSAQAVRTLASLNPNALLCVIGCFSQADVHRVRTLPNVKLVLGTINKNELINLIQTHLNQNKPQPKLTWLPSILSAQHASDDIWAQPFGNYTGLQTRSFVKIQDGCEYNCSYCIIPQIRGYSTSKPLAMIIQECEKLLISGVKEIVLCGINLACYGLELTPKTDLLTLLKTLTQKFRTYQFRFRLSSLEPNAVSDELIAWIANNKFIAQQLHLPLQSGSDSVLKLMRRQYCVDEYRKIVQKLRQANPFFTVTTDIIVGFSNETDTDFQATYQLLASLNIMRAHIFPFSERQKTAASFLPKIPTFERRQRVRNLIKLLKPTTMSVYQQFCQRSSRVLLETKTNVLGQEYWTGYSDEYIRFYIPTMPKYCSNQFVNVVATKLFHDGLLGN